METNAAILCKSYISPALPALPTVINLGSAHDDDLFRQLHGKGFLETLLLDRTTKKGIFWATDTYSDLGAGFGKHDEITPELIIGRYSELASIRKDRRIERTRKHGEVSTPLAVCKQMWDCAYKSIRGKDWQKFIDSTVLEITCGEAPFLTSRRDLGNGKKIQLSERAGILDRKLQVIGEKAKGIDEWLKWAFKAYESTYGYEFQGDNILLARLNLFATFEDYFRERWGLKPSVEDNKRILDILSWNIWQMDGLTGTIPYGTLTVQKQCSFFEQKSSSNESSPCLIRDWKKGSVITYLSCKEAQ